MLLSLLAACVTQDNFFDKYGQTYCDKIFACEDEESDVEDVIDEADWSDADECLDDYSDTVDDDVLDCYRDPDICEFDADKARECLSDIKGADCNDLFDSDTTENCDLDEVYDCDDSDLQDCILDAAGGSSDDSG